MALFVYVACGDGLGEDPIDLHDCKRFRVREDERGTLFYHLMKDGQWIREYYDPYESANSFRYAHVNEVAHDLLLEVGQLPEAIKKDTHFDPMTVSDRAKYRNWMKQFASEAPPPHGQTKPRWDREEQVIYFGNIACRRYRREAPNQFAILDAFERAGWPESVSSPLDSEQLKDALRAFKDEMGKDNLFRLRKQNQRVRWERSLRKNGQVPHKP